MDDLQAKMITMSQGLAYAWGRIDAEGPKGVGSYAFAVAWYNYVAKCGTGAREYDLRQAYDVLAAGGAL